MVRFKNQTPGQIMTCILCYCRKENWLHEIIEPRVIEILLGKDPEIEVTAEKVNPILKLMSTWVGPEDEAELWTLARALKENVEIKKRIEEGNKVTFVEVRHPDDDDEDKNPPSGKEIDYLGLREILSKEQILPRGGDFERDREPVLRKETHGFTKAGDLANKTIGLEDSNNAQREYLKGLTRSTARHDSFWKVPKNRLKDFEEKIPDKTKEKLPIRNVFLAICGVLSRPLDYEAEIANKDEKIFIKIRYKKDFCLASGMRSLSGRSWEKARRCLRILKRKSKTIHDFYYINQKHGLMIELLKSEWNSAEGFDKVNPIPELQKFMKKEHLTESKMKGFLFIRRKESLMQANRPQNTKVYAKAIGLDKKRNKKYFMNQMLEFFKNVKRFFHFIDRLALEENQKTKETFIRIVPDPFKFNYDYSFV